MKQLILTLVSLFVMSACSQLFVAPNEHEASASLAQGSVSAKAEKQMESQQTCFQIKMILRDVKREEADWKNWQIKAYDLKGKTYQVENQHGVLAQSVMQTISRRQYYYEQFSNSLRTCLPLKKDIAKLELIPLQLSLSSESLVFQWKN